MTDQDLIITALRQSGVIVAEHLEPGWPRDADEAITRLIGLLDLQDLAAAMDRLEKHRLRVVK